MKQRGFSLLEALVAIAIFVIIGLATVSVQDHIIKTNEASISAFDQLEKLQRAMLIIEQDFRQVVSRQVKNDDNERFQGVIASPNLFESEADAIAFVRAGYFNPRLMLPRSTLQPVTYRLQNNQLQRITAPYVDSIIGDEPRVKNLLDGVEDFQLTFFNAQNTATENWQSGPLPKAVELRLVTTQWGEITRLFMLPEAAQ